MDIPGLDVAAAIGILDTGGRKKISGRPGMEASAAHTMNGAPEMNRSELINTVAEKTGTPRTQVEAVVAATLKEIMAATSTGEKVVLAGFGTFEARDRAAREGRNPATGEPLQIAASRAAAFKPATAFKQQVAGTAE